MIQNKTARNLMYSWHNGQTSALYAAAASGLVACWGALEYEINKLRGIDAFKSGDNQGTIDADKLTEWIAMKRKNAKHTQVQGRDYYALPWRGTWGCKA